MHHCGHIFFRMRLGRHFLEKLMTLGLHWGPFGRPWGAFFCNFCKAFSGSDFRLILDMLLVGVGGRGVAAERCRFCRLAKDFITPLPPAGVRRIYRLPPLPPTSMHVSEGWVAGRI